MSDRVEDSLSDAVIRRLDEDLVEGADEVMSSLHVDRHRMSQAWNRAVAFAVRTSPVQQFGIGFGVGWISGYLFKKVSKTAAFFVGCTFLAVQGAIAAGIININWVRLRRAAEQRISHVQRLAGNTEHANALDQFVNFATRHIYISSGFATGAVMAITF